MTKTKIIIVDYGLGNLFNLQRAIEAIGAEALISSDSAQISNADKLILPGVGAFEDGMKGFSERGLITTIHNFADSGRLILGICLGMQLLMEWSEEHGLHKGLDLVKGRVVRFKEPDRNDLKYKIPQIGWNSLKFPDSLPEKDKSWKDNTWENTILKGLGNESYMYFLHSYIVVLNDPKNCIAVTEYGRDKYCSVLEKENIMGCQFHPERSGEKGLSILRNFIFLK